MFVWPWPDTAGYGGSSPRKSRVERYPGEATNSFGMIDFHHLNAGIPGSAGGFPDLSAADFDRVMAVNGGSSVVSTVRDSGGGGAWDFGALDERTYRREERS